jgi:[acyl-carrier-protein] S-malonyltransferase
MAAILGLANEVVESICAQIKNDIVVPANYNCNGQVVISGTIRGVEQACKQMLAAGAKRAIQLNVSGAFHSPLMQGAREELADAIKNVPIQQPICPIYQNVDAAPHTNPDEIKQNLMMQLTAPVKWQQTMLHMEKDGAAEFIELGPGNVLQGLIKKTLSNATVCGIQ